jgi:hypothetical protein
MITTAGNGPDPSGLNSVAGICSKAPLGAVVVIDREVVATQPPRSKKESISSVSLVRIVLPAKGLARLSIRDAQFRAGLSGLIPVTCCGGAKTPSRMSVFLTVGDFPFTVRPD